MNRLAFVLTLLSLLLGLGWVVSAHSSVEESPRVIRAVAPKDYPPLASAAMVSGNVKIEVRIDNAGDVIEAQIIEGHKLLQDISKTAALHWKFAPSEEGPKQRTAQLTFTFIHWTKRQEKERGTTTFVPPCGIELVGRTVYVQRESIR
jgi:TonB family protein